MRWEHLTIALNLGGFIEDGSAIRFRSRLMTRAAMRRDDPIDSLGRDGWELVAVTPAGDERLLAFFRRPIPNSLTRWQAVGRTWRRWPYDQESA